MTELEKELCCLFWFFNLAFVLARCQKKPSDVDLSLFFG
jgi:hypothetical protein